MTKSVFCYFTDEETIRFLEINWVLHCHRADDNIYLFFCLFIHLLILQTFIERRLWDVVGGDLNKEA